MGIYDRDYYREERGGMGFRPPLPVVTALIVLNVAILIIDFLATPEVRPGSRTLLQDYLGMTPTTLYQPWQWYRFVTYGFVHDQRLFHLIGNMLILYFFGTEIAERLGRAEFLRFYFLCLVAGSVAWALYSAADAAPENVRMFGASGAAVGVLVLFALYYPRRTVLAYFVIPIPAWLLGAIVVGADLFGALGGGTAPIAYIVHLTGAAVAFLYHRLRWNLGRPIERLADGIRRWRRPRLRVVHPPTSSADNDDDSAIDDEEVDRILAKLSASGLGSLTAAERRTLQAASQEYKRKLRRGHDPRAD